MDWLESERLFREADAHKPPGQRFEYWTQYQTDAKDQWLALDPHVMLLFFPTGKGKSKTSLALLALLGYEEVVVITPPKVQLGWAHDARTLGMKVRLESIEKYRQASSKYNPRVPIIYDEFHKAGGRGAAGFEKINRMAPKYKALGTPVILASATPNYNDAERVFCLQAVGAPRPHRNYMKWLIDNCVLTPNRFGYYPICEGFLQYGSAIDYLRDQPWVAYVEDEAVWTADEVDMPTPDLTVFEDYGYSLRHHRIMASDMEKRHKRVDLQLITDHGWIYVQILRELFGIMDQYEDRTHWMIVCAHKTVANALARSLPSHHTWLITGDTKDIEPIKEGFIKAEHGILIGTTALAEGVDGLDKVCQSMIILDDIDGDHAKRRQIIGRILPRGRDDGKERLVITAIYK